MATLLSRGGLAIALGIFCASAVQALPPDVRPWTAEKPDPRFDSSIPLFFRSTAGTTWVDVGQPCAVEDTLNSTHGPDEVWCFEGANGDSTWPSVPPAQNTGSSHERWTHWSIYDPPITPNPKWHVTDYNPNPHDLSNPYNAWCGCDISTCPEVILWADTANQEGYGDSWNYSLVLDMQGQNAVEGGTISFDLRYDTECNYDYLYLEYFDSGTDRWTILTDSTGAEARFNAVSGNPDTQHGGSGRKCGNDIFYASDERDLGGGPEPFYGNSVWLDDVTFPMPEQGGGLLLRWRATSDIFWSDADDQGDTDGLAAIDDVVITFTSTGSVVSDDFASGDLSGVSATVGSATWTSGTIGGSHHDGWHLEFDPKYKNKGSTCTFSDDWMWTAKPAGEPIPASGFHFMLISPVIDCDGWTGGVMEYSNYMCMQLDDATNTRIRTYSTAHNMWGLWQDFDNGYVIVGGCEFWNMNDFETLTQELGASVDSLQLAFEVLDLSLPSDYTWGLHGAVQFVVDNVSIGSFDGSSTVFQARGIDIFADTFSRMDPAHTPFFQNSQQGAGVLSGPPDSLNVEVTDVDGVVASQVDLVWRVADTDPPAFGPWQSKVMTYSAPDPNAEGDGGTYRGTFGDDLVASEDYSGTVGDGFIWEAGTTVEYYVRVEDVLSNVATFPSAAADPVAPNYYRFEVLPFVNRTVGEDDERILIVDDYGRSFLDFGSSEGFDPVGGAGFGSFSEPEYDQPEDMVERALGLMYGIADPEDNPAWDIYDVGGAGSSMQCEPRIASAAPGIGGLGDDASNPLYDAVIWLQGSFDTYSYLDTTRINLKAWLDAGGHLWSNGDEVAYFLGTGGLDADSLINFLGEYLGTSFTNVVDDQTESRVLNVCGEAGTSLEGVTLGLYGECPTRRAFDRMYLAPTGVDQVNSVLATYCQGGPSDEGRISIVKNVRLDGGMPTGVAIHSGFGLGALLSDESRATLLARTFVDDFGLWDMGYDGVRNGVDAPVVSAGIGFRLAAPSPNPFESTTAIGFSVPRRERVTIELYNILGQRVCTLLDEVVDAGSGVREWDGRSDTGDRASTGIYFAKMTAGDFRATRKVMLLK
jgi:hypothetical protein